MDDFDTMPLPPYLTSPLSINTMQNGGSDYLSAMPLDMQAPQQTPVDHDPFVRFVSFLPSFARLTLTLTIHYLSCIAAVTTSALLLSTP